MGRRLFIYAALLLGLGVLLAIIGFAGIYACAPPALPGDELWTLRQMLGETANMLVRAAAPACFNSRPPAPFALALAAQTLPLLAFLGLLALLWEGPGRALRRLWFRQFGGHALLLGDAEGLDGLLRPRFTGTALVAPDDAAMAGLRRLRPFGEIAAYNRGSLAKTLAALGASRANRLAAVSPTDLTNLHFAEAAIGEGGKGDLLVRLEQGAIRALAGNRLRLAAEAQGRSLAIVSLNQLTTRLSLAAAMPGRYTLEGSPRPHFAVIGHGEPLLSLLVDLMRQGYGRDAEKPLISVLVTAGAETALALEPFLATEAAEIRLATANLSLSGGLDRALAGLLVEAPPLLAIHCVAPGGEALPLALRVEDVVSTLGLPLPPIVAAAETGGPTGTTGLLRVVTAPTLATAARLTDLMDRRARAVHEGFLAAQRQARGTAFGSAPAETGWDRLPDGFRDDNRAVADQMDYKLAQIFMATAPGDEGADLTPAEIEVLAVTAHARWWAAKAVSGWKVGAVRADRAMLHPDMRPYAELSEPVRQKDRDEVASLPGLARLAGEALQRERRICCPTPLDEGAVVHLLAELAKTPKTFRPVLVIALGAESMLPLAQRLSASGVSLELVLPLAGAVSAPTLLASAWRLHRAPVAQLPAIARARSHEQVDARGEIHALG